MGTGSVGVVSRGPMPAGSGRYVARQFSSLLGEVGSVATKAVRSRRTMTAGSMAQWEVGNWETADHRVFH